MALNIQINNVTDANYMELTANGVSLGTVGNLHNMLLWSVGSQSETQVRFSIKDTERLSKILRALEEYKNKNGYEDVIIRNCPGDIGTFFTKEEWKELGYEIALGGTYYETIK